MTSDARYVIWSFEHRAWWAPGRRGYTPDLGAAGRYRRTDARRIVQQANRVRVHEECLTLEEALAEERTTGPRR